MFHLLAIVLVSLCGAGNQGLAQTFATGFDCVVFGDDGLK
jgi:hypothetical protein